MKFCHYIQPQTVEEAAAWAKRPDAVILGGMMWLRLQKRTVQNAVDLSLLGLDRIEETEDAVRIGASVTLRQLETDSLLRHYTQGAVQAALSPIVGVQFRNTATVGGSVFGRFGFSDVSTLLTALCASVVLAEAGVVPLEQFMASGAPRDLLTHILLPKTAPDKVFVTAHRNAATDFPVLTAAFCKQGENVRMTFSPAPVRGKTMDFYAATAEEITAEAEKELSFGSNAAASGEYRAHLSRVFLKRGLAALGE